MHRYFTMPLLHQARSVTEACAGRTPLEVLQLIRITLRAIAHVHEKGILHRDIKPENLLFVPQRNLDPDRVFVIDFGHAKRISSSMNDRLVSIVGPDGFGGSPEYAAPELLRDGKGVANLRTELVSAGIVVLEMLTGRRLYWLSRKSSDEERLEAANSFWSGETHPRASDLLSASWHTSAEAYRKRNDPGYGELHNACLHAFDRIIRCATHEEPARRYDSVAALDEELGHAAEWLADIGSKPEQYPHPPKFTHQAKLPATGDPFIRQYYRDRVANDAALLHGSNALLDRYDYPRAQRLLGLISSAGRTGFEYGYTRARAHPYLFEFGGEEQ
jgi:serine/threonine protein kinase